MSGSSFSTARPRPGTKAPEAWPCPRSNISPHFDHKEELNKSGETFLTSLLGVWWLFRTPEQHPNCPFYNISTCRGSIQKKASKVPQSCQAVLRPPPTPFRLPLTSRRVPHAAMNRLTALVQILLYVPSRLEESHTKQPSTVVDSYMWPKGVQSLACVGTLHIQVIIGDDIDDYSRQ